MALCVFLFFFQAEDGIRDHCVTGVQTCALPISTFFPWPLSWIGPGVGVGVGVGEPDCAQYLPPVLKASGKSGPPPQTIISLPVRSEERRVGKECRSR